MPQRMISKARTTRALHFNLMNSFLYRVTVLALAVSLFIPTPWAQAMMAGLLAMISHSWGKQPKNEYAGGL
jgi:hypothetical protein